jgi:hypothetical protein
MADTPTDSLLAPIANATHREVAGIAEDVFIAGDARIKRVVYPPGYRWSSTLKPVVGTESCMHAHVGFLARGHMRVLYPDGTVEDIVAPQPTVVRPGHDAEVVGDETAVFIQFDFERDTAARCGLRDA